MNPRSSHTQLLIKFLKILFLCIFEIRWWYKQNSILEIMRKQILIVFALFATILSFGQDDFKRNAIYVEAGGNGLFGSANYERQLTKKPALGVRIGVGFYTENAFYLTIPVGVNYLFRLNNDKSFIDVGLGGTWTRLDGKLFKDIKNSDKEHFVNFIPSIGYRRHASKDLMWRISLTPVVNKYAFTPSIGASIGKRF